MRCLPLLGLADSARAGQRNRLMVGSGEAARVVPVQRVKAWVKQEASA